MPSPRTVRAEQVRKRDILLYLAIGALGAGVAVVLHVEVNLLFTKLAGSQELPFLACVYLVLYGVLWVLFAWQPGAIRRVLISLKPIVRDDFRSLDDNTFLQSTQRPGNVSAKWLTRGVFWILVLPAVLVYALASGQFWHESPPVLLGINPFQFYGPWILLFCLNAYFLTAVLLRHCVAVQAINHLVTAHSVSPKAFHSDGANGLGGIGHYAAQTGSLAVVYGLWIGVMLAIGYYRNVDSPGGWSSLALLLFYIVALALLAVFPLLVPHAVMRAHKQHMLDRVGAQIQVRLDHEYDAVEDVTTLDRILKLRDVYRLVGEAYGEWPVHMGLLKGFSLAAAVAFISQIISIGPKLFAYLGH